MTEQKPPRYRRHSRAAAAPLSVPDGGRVLSVEPGKSIVALKNVSANEAHFVGHFPGHQVMPAC
jgi:3-hydroxymyristoyl/3-hydroxydecanoyl-(acyl carrier protein) dehydratase